MQQKSDDQIQVQAQSTRSGFTFYLTLPDIITMQFSSDGSNSVRCSMSVRDYQEMNTFSVRSMFEILLDKHLVNIK